MTRGSTDRSAVRIRLREDAAGSSVKLFFYIVCGILLAPVVGIFALLVAILGPWNTNGTTEDREDDLGDDDAGEDVDG